MGIFRLAFLAFLAVATLWFAASLFGSAAAAGLASFAAVLFLPLILLKVLFVIMLLGFLGRSAFGGGRHRNWTGQASWSRRPAPESAPSAEERFEEWHRMAHAREEVDSWTPEV